MQPMQPMATRPRQFHVMIEPCDDMKKSKNLETTSAHTEVGVRRHLRLSARCRLPCRNGSRPAYGPHRRSWCAGASAQADSQPTGSESMYLQDSTVPIVDTGALTPRPNTDSSRRLVVRLALGSLWRRRDRQPEGGSCPGEGESNLVAPSQTILLQSNHWTSQYRLSAALGTRYRRLYSTGDIKSVSASTSLEKLHFWLTALAERFGGRKPATAKFCMPGSLTGKKINMTVVTYD
jgi:hypothetical protein